MFVSAYHFLTPRSSGVVIEVRHAYIIAAGLIIFGFGSGK